MVNPLAIRIHGVPMDLGQERRGVDMGPSALRYAELQKHLENLGHQVVDGGNITAPNIEELRKRDTTPEDGLAHNIDAIIAVCTEVYKHTKTTLENGEIAVTLGGDHSISIGTIAGAIEHQPNIGVLWVDAHADFNTPEITPSGNVHGMVISSLMGLCPPKFQIGPVALQAHQVVYIGLRDVDPKEKVALVEHGIKVFTMRDVDELGMAQVARAMLRHFEGVEHLHISLDLDSLDPQYAPGVGTPVQGGLSYREAHLLMEVLADDGRVKSVDVVEVNPILDVTNRTAELGVELTMSLFGRRILL